ncbi:ribosomal protein S18-alanine N-acetyltransferase [Pseudomonas sp. OIL-1]|uniref:ribosomal protein S18-alanine N-acetyltransferase n=1 Tax=Pseudomonas sp. OIL-1 TaxID=2706126 RepID=UPI0013A78B78|nr:ribosomal protein S18-alanine N-acetyltransferase [Pseudomonas sp. OIL-1]QIB50873.1 ribosomal protein S18-alanine N-acetyltransferase [Pseudomonas sp. OIL-1]
MSDLYFRPMGESDVDTVLDIECSAFSHPWTRGIFLDCIRSGYECWVSFEGNTQVGHGVLSAAAQESHLLNLTVRPDCQGRGYGLRMLEQLMERAKYRDAEVAFLEVRESNISAIRLYENFGFNEIGRRRGYYPAAQGQEDALVMAFSLLD